MPYQQLRVDRAATAENKSRVQSLVFVLRGRMPALRPVTHVNITHEPIVAANSPQCHRLQRKLPRINQLDWRRKRDSF
jgi:hypothetical protein